MLDLDRRISFEVEFNRVAIAVAELLVRHMDDAFLWLIHQNETQRDGPHQRTAELANRIAVLGRRLVDEIQCYQRCDQMRRELEQQEISDDDLPF
jgi:hypothetical protein